MNLASVAEENTLQFVGVSPRYPFSSSAASTVCTPGLFLSTHSSFVQHSKNSHEITVLKEPLGRTVGGMGNPRVDRVQNIPVKSRLSRAAAISSGDAASAKCISTCLRSSMQLKSSYPSPRRSFVCATYSTHRGLRFVFECPISSPLSVSSSLSDGLLCFKFSLLILFIKFLLVNLSIISLCNSLCRRQLN